MIRAVPRDQPVGGGLRDQVLELTPAALGGDREAAVLDQRAGIDEVGDVLASGAAAGGMASLDRFAARLVAGQRLALAQLAEVRALWIAASRLLVRHERHVPRRRRA